MPSPEASRANGKKGGRRHGSKGAATLDKEGRRAKYEGYMADRMDTLNGAQFATACGVSQFVYRDKKGQFKVIDDPDELKKRCAAGEALEIFTRLPNAQAQTDILNRLLDKPKEQPQQFNLVHGLDDKVMAILQNGRKRVTG